jgi:hypothetical protein
VLSPKKELEHMFPPEEIGSKLLEHENRITRNETSLLNLKSEFKEIKDILHKSNDEQKEKLDKIDRRLMEEFFEKERTHRNNAWKLAIKIAGSLVGAGGFLYLLLDKIM